jgi:hypothetical protein
MDGGRLSALGGWRRVSRLDLFRDSFGARRQYSDKSRRSRRADAGRTVIGKLGYAFWLALLAALRVSSAVPKQPQ